MGERQSLRYLQIFSNSDDQAPFVQMVVIGLDAGFLEDIVIVNWQFATHPRIRLCLGDNKRWGLQVLIAVFI